MSTKETFKRNRELPTKDWLEYRNARELAQTIREYWAKKGLAINIRIEPVPMENPSSEYLYQIRSNLFCGKSLEKLNVAA